MQGNVTGWVAKVLTTLLFFLGAGAVRAQSEASYQLLTASLIQPCAFTVNGFPFQEFTGTNRLSGSTLADPYLVLGTNVFVMRCADVAKPLALFESALARLMLDYGSGHPTNRVQVLELVRQTYMPFDLLEEKVDVSAGTGFTYRIGAKLSGVHTVHTVDVGGRQANYRHVDGVGTNTVEVRMVLDSARLTALPWQGAATVLDDTARAEIRALAGSFQQAIATRDLNQMVALLGKRQERYAQARGRAMADEEADTRLIYGGLFDDPTFTVTPLDLAQLQFRTFEGVNLVQVMLNGGHPIRASGGSGANTYRFMMPLYASKIEGQWRCVE
jgi:hypothetical protein